NQGITEFDKLMEEKGITVEDEKGHILFFIIPLAVVIAVTLYTDDLLIGLASALVVMAVMYLPTKAVPFGEFCEAFASGCASMVPMMFITIGALTVKLSMDGIGLPDFVINAVLPYMNGALFPAITF
ncbi:hypothetical protein LH384_32380, partial [Pseudomonas aeruginosa]|nr:hypothetical protein [Pseudomonas aeruginosa]